MASLDAIRLVQLGARAGLVSQLTGIDKTTANRLYRQVHGRPSPPGQTPFTDTWFLKSDQRMLHAAIVWRCHQRLSDKEIGAGRRLIEVYEAYSFAVTETLLDITQVAFVPRLVEMGLWQERRCSHCATTYPGPIEEPGNLCPGCRLYQRFRCLGCNAAAEGLRRGRRHKACPHCGAPRSM